MPRQYEVDSSNLHFIEYDDEIETLTVTFRNGMRYEYIDVTSDEYAQLMNAESIGAYFNRNIRKSKQYVRMFDK